jgi:hypothetical protein
MKFHKILNVKRLKRKRIGDNLFIVGIVEVGRKVHQKTKRIQIQVVLIHIEENSFKSLKAETILTIIVFQNNLKQLLQEFMNLELHVDVVDIEHLL